MSVSSFRIVPLRRSGRRTVIVFSPLTWIFWPDDSTSSTVMSAVTEKVLSVRREAPICLSASMAST